MLPVPARLRRCGRRLRLRESAGHHTEVPPVVVDVQRAAGPRGHLRPGDAQRLDGRRHVAALVLPRHRDAQLRQQPMTERTLRPAAGQPARATVLITGGSPAAPARRASRPAHTGRTWTSPSRPCAVPGPPPRFAAASPPTNRCPSPAPASARRAGPPARAPAKSASARSVNGNRSAVSSSGRRYRTRSPLLAEPGGTPRLDHRAGFLLLQPSGDEQLHRPPGPASPSVESLAGTLDLGQQAALHPVAEAERLEANLAVVNPHQDQVARGRLALARSR